MLRISVMAVHSYPMPTIAIVLRTGLQWEGVGAMA
jgi:hypothetical protein